MVRKQSNVDKPTLEKEAPSSSVERQFVDYLNAALARAVYKELEDGTWFAQVPELRGVWANASNRSAAALELAEVIKDWVALGQSWGEDIPVLDGIDLNHN